jgi:hypothetical protein
MNGAGVGAADGDGHPAYADGERVAAERTEMHGLNRHALVEAELAQAAGLSFFQRRPIDRVDPRTPAELERIERERELAGWCRRRHCD